MDPIEKAINEMQTRMNNALADLPPIEQVGLAQEMVYAIRACRRANEEIKGVFEILRGKVTEIETMATRKREEITAEVKAELVKDVAFLKASGLITQADHDSAVTAARTAESEKVKAEVDKAVATIQQVAERRKALVSDKKMSAVAAEALSDEVLTGDDFLTKVEKITPRLQKLATLKGLAEDADTIKRVVGFPITAEGEAAFADSFGIWEKAAKSGGGGPGAPLNPPPKDEAKPVLFF